MAIGRAHASAKAADITKLHTVGELIKKRKLQFLQKIESSSNTVCNLFMSVAVRESELLAAST